MKEIAGSRETAKMIWGAVIKISWGTGSRGQNSEGSKGPSMQTPMQTYRNGIGPSLVLFSPEKWQKDTQEHFHLCHCGWFQVVGLKSEFQVTRESTWPGQDPSSCPALCHDWLLCPLRTRGHTSQNLSQVPHEHHSGFTWSYLSGRGHSERGLMTGNTFGNRKVVRTTQSFKPLPFVVIILKMAKTGPMPS